MGDAAPDIQPQSLPDSKVANDGQKHQQSSDGHSNKKMRCGQCQECRMPDCGTCKFYRDKKKFGGPGKLKKSCVKHHCTMLHETSLNAHALIHDSNADNQATPVLYQPRRRDKHPADSIEPHKAY